VSRFWAPERLGEPAVKSHSENPVSQDLADSSVVMMLGQRTSLGLNLPHMTRLRSFTWTLAAIAALSAAGVESLAQTAANPNAVSNGPVIVKLSQPVYPPLGKQARIIGDVEVVLGIRPDGSVESATVVSGHPVLKQAALDSAQQSQYECISCSDSVTSYRVLYTFQLIVTGSCCTTTDGGPNNNKQGQPYPQVTQSQNHVTVVDQPVCICDPAGTIGKARSFKCLYLWRCSSR
jgi:hypothetical protein